MAEILQQLKLTVQGTQRYKSIDEMLRERDEFLQMTKVRLKQSKDFTPNTTINSTQIELLKSATGYGS